MTTAFERHQTIIHGGIPDKVGVMAATGLRTGSQGGVFRRLVDRGLCLRHIVPPHQPSFFYPGSINPYLNDVIYTQQIYAEAGHWNTRHILETPVGTVDSISARSLDVNVSSESPQTHFVKRAEDWRIINYVFRRMVDELRPNYDEMVLDQDELGETGYTIAFIDKTPYQRAWIELASLEETVFACVDKPDEFTEYLEIQRAYHARVAEIAAGSPSDFVVVNDNITNTISPNYYAEYCNPIYQLYVDAFQGTDKVLAVHHDGLLEHLKGVIADAPFQVIDSLTVPPSGNVSLTEAQTVWPDKIPFINLPPHLTWKTGDELRKAYSQIVSEWNSKKMVFVHVEDMPPELLEGHLTAVLDVCGY